MYVCVPGVGPPERHKYLYIKSAHVEVFYSLQTCSFCLIEGVSSLTLQVQWALSTRLCYGCCRIFFSELVSY